MIRQFLLACAIGGVPALCLLLMGLSGAAGWTPVTWSLLLTAGASAILAGAALWMLDRLAEALRAAASGTVLSLPPMRLLREVAEALDRLTRDLAESGALVGRLRAADAVIVEALPDPLLVLGADRQPLRANAAARRLFGSSAGDQMPGDLWALLRHPMLAGAVDRALLDGAPQASDLTLPAPVFRDLVAQVIPLDPPLSDGGRLLILLSDRTRDRAVERMRADFVANASHELRTPLASLIGFIETLRGPAEDDAEARRHFLGIMAEQAERMRRLIDDLLGLTRIEISEHQPPAGQVDLVVLARAETEALAPILAQRRTRLRLDLEPALARPADQDQLAQVLRNLVENAVRYGREGGEVRVATGAAEGGVFLRVADDGPGIAREHIPRLTERFYRVDKGRSRHVGGTGLGLAIVKHVVNRHRGRLAIESAVGEGASFRVWLPGVPAPFTGLEPRPEKRVLSVREA
ncbi:Phosphate regulon sensor protein phoR [Roseomonas mucosa]|uniref:ATP-binding protein n=1 Tax=Roseomonas TaxID=125216 RepID=UPI0009631346|nr:MULTISPECIES: ATP-binding protein [Roseomonas]ATR22073.1 two-component sensor histidine kinase [Roseomonas sp. FDAARGOS_362]USQ73220.1 ATP-binding protein [Roseomonas mucosa]UZO95429.1 Phosphate regulon sensor protein phoR [Roseomonas mucosa]GAV34361.1 phosphate regulon sensor protein PhoR [Roseomonas sp. TAS13]